MPSIPGRRTTNFTTGALFHKGKSTYYFQKGVHARCAHAYQPSDRTWKKPENQSINQFRKYIPTVNNFSRLIHTHPRRLAVRFIVTPISKLRCASINPSRVENEARVEICMRQREIFRLPNSYSNLFQRFTDNFFKFIKP